MGRLMRRRLKLCGREEIFQVVENKCDWGGRRFKVIRFVCRVDREKAF